MQTSDFSFEIQKFSFWMVFPFELEYNSFLSAPAFSLMYSFIYSKHSLSIYYVLGNIPGFFFCWEKMIINKSYGVMREHISDEMTFRLRP